MNFATEPSDILWKNMTGQRGLFIIRRAILSAIGILIIVFGTSPAVIAANVEVIQKYTGLSKFIQYWLAGNFISKYISPLITILVNQMLLLLIDWASMLESYSAHSFYQRAIFIKSVVYLSLNMMVVPALSLNSEHPSSIWGQIT